MGIVGMRPGLFAAAFGLVVSLAGPTRADGWTVSCDDVSDCPPSMVCGPDGWCGRRACAVDAECAPDGDRCLGGRCYGPSDGAWLEEALAQYEREKKAPAIGLLLGLVPGLGSAYGDDPWQAVLLPAWIGGAGMMGGGVHLMLGDEPDVGATLAALGAAIFLGAMIGSPIWGLQSVVADNEELFERTLRLRDPHAPPPAAVRVGLAPGAFVMRW